MNFDFSYSEYEKLKEYCGFTDEELTIFQLKRKGYSNVHISIELDIPLRTITRRIGKIKRKISKELDRI